MYTYGRSLPGVIELKVGRTPAANTAPLLLVGGYRDNEVTSSAHPLWLFLDEMRNKGVSSKTIVLQVHLI
jgi:hypothetical protein